MPDSSPTGKRLHLERMVALGMVAPATEPPQGARDAAHDLVGRVIGMHTRDLERALFALVVCYAALGLVTGFVWGWALG